MDIKRTTASIGIVGALATAVVVGAVLYIGGANPKTGVPDPITVDGQTIEFTWTDDNTGEDIHIYTDRATYTDGLSHATVYVAVANRSGMTQDVELMAHFRDTKKRIEDVKVLTEVTKEINEPIYEERCAALTKGATSSECYQEQTGTTTRQETSLEWVPLDTVVRTPTEMTKEETYLQSKTIKTVEGFIAEKKTEGYTIPADGVVYYKVHVEFPANDDDNFYFTAVGSQGAYGHLDPWFNSSWPYRVKIEVNPTKVGTSSAVTNFPVYLDLAGMPNDFWTNVSSTGADIRMVESDETTETAFELVSISTTTKRGELHFLADSLSTTSTSTFYLYYGNATATAYAVTATYGRNNVWTNYKAVYHLEDITTDYSGNANTLVNYNTLTSATGPVANGATQGTGNTNKSLYLNTDFGITGTGNYSISMFAKPNAEITTGSWNLFTLGNNGAGSAARRVLYDYNGGTRQLRFIRTGSTYVPVIVNRTFGTDWQHIVMTYNGTTFTGYHNGDSVGTSATANTTSSQTESYRFNVGAHQRTNEVASMSFDEIRVSTSTFSSAYILTEYNNQSSTSTFLTIGAQATDSVLGAAADNFWDDI